MPRSLSGCSRKVYLGVHCPLLRNWGKPIGRSEIMQSDHGQLSRLLPLLDSSRGPDSVAAARHQQHHFTRCITTEAITLTGLPNSNSEKNLYQGSFFKSISSGLISRLYKGWWQGNGRERRITLCKSYIGASRDAAAVGYTAPASTADTVQFYWSQKNRETEAGSSEVFVFSPTAEADGLDIGTRHHTSTRHHKGEYGQTGILNHFSLRENKVLISSCKKKIIIMIMIKILTMSA